MSAASAKSRSADSRSEWLPVRERLSIAPPATAQLPQRGGLRRATAAAKAAGVSRARAFCVRCVRALGLAGAQTREERS